MTKISSQYLFVVGVLAGAAIVFFFDESTRIWIAIGYVCLSLAHYSNVGFEQLNTSIVELDERLVERIEDIERQQFRLCEANSRIERIEKELMSLEYDIIES